MADTNEEGFDGWLVVLIPESSDPIVAASSQPAHMTTIWFGDADEASSEVIEQVRQEVEAYAKGLNGPVVVPVEGRGTLGDDEADVIFLEGTDSLLALREGLIPEGSSARAAFEAAEQYPQWTPHVTLGYPDAPALAEYDGDTVTFDRIGLWVAGEHHDFVMGGEMGTEITASAELKVLRARAEAFEMAEVIADVPDDEELPLDELEEGEELLEEIPVHGVATLEGKPTGDGRGFRPGAINFGRLPAPLGYEFESSHGGDNSRVAIVGRIDEFFTVPSPEHGEGVFEVRWRGVIMPGKEYGARAIESIIDGSYDGLSVIVDDVTIDVEEARERTRRDLEQQESANEALNSGGEMDIESMVDMLVGDGTTEVTWFSSARVRRFDMVPTGAFQEGYVGLGHEFPDELTDEQLTAAAAALEDCGCLQASGEPVVDLTLLTPEELATYDEMSPQEQIRFATERGLILNFRDYSEEERRELAEEGKALPDGSFPIADVEDLRNAIQSIGRAGDPDEAKAHIKKRARELDQEGLIPEGWDAEAVVAAAFAPGTKDGPGWITHPIPTARIRRYWVRGKGAAKIRWGAPGDFNRCRAQLAKYVQNPEWLAGLCANMHKEALGIWPGQHHTAGSITASASPLFSLVAAVEPVDAAFFQNPMLTQPTGVTVDGDRVYGHLASWNVCHIGEPEGQGSCTLAPHSATNYAHFRTGTVMTTEGPVAVGQLTMNTGHAGQNLGPGATVSHYDNTGTVAADVACGEDAHGIWFSGRIRPTLSDDDRYALAASGRLSGDWRRIGNGYELVAALVVNVPGFPIPRTSLAASAELGSAISLVAAGVVDSSPEDDPGSPSSPEGGIADAELIAGIATAAAEQVLYVQERNRVVEKATEARSALNRHLLQQARAKLTEIQED